MRPLKKHLTSTNAWRLFLLVVLVLAVRHVRQEKLLGDVVIKHGESREAGFRELVHDGLWHGAAARAVMAVLLLGLSFVPAGPPRSGSVRQLRLAAGGTDPLKGTIFAGVLSLIVLAAAWPRWSRMDDCFWGDESDAIATYVHGSYREAEKGDLQGALVFHQPTWKETWFGAVQGPNNHVLFSVLSRCCLETWRKLTQQPETEFDEWPARVPSFLGGLASLVTLALLLRRWGAPRLGLLAAAFMSLHPWHLRYSTEARGYGLVLALLPLLLHVLTDALESNRWKNWVAFGLVEFLLLYSWAGIFYAVAVVNLTTAAILLGYPDRRESLLRWATANLAAAGVFVSLYAPLLPQIKRAQQHLLRLKGKPMDVAWLHDVLAAPFAGIPFHRVVTTNPAELSWQSGFIGAPVLTVIGLTAILGLSGLGLITLWRRNRCIAALVGGFACAAVVCGIHFKFFIRDEMRLWYLIFTLPALCICLAAGAGTLAGWSGSARRSWIVVPAAFFAIAAVWWPVDASLVRFHEEDYCGAVAASRGRHENPEVIMPTSNVFACWLWRHSSLYDPRGDPHVRDAGALRRRMETARAAAGELYVIVGYRELAESLNADMLRMLEDPLLFEKRAIFPARESLHTLEVYRMAELKGARD